MAETFSHCKIARGYDNIAGLTNIETISVSGQYFREVDDLGKWADGSGVMRGDGITGGQGFPATSWVSGVISLDQWYYLYRNILRGNRAGPVTFQTRRYDPLRWVIGNAVLDIGQPPTLGKTPHGYFRPFVWRFSRIVVLEEQGMYGSIKTKDGSTQQADITTTPVLLTGFATNGLYSGVTVSYTTNTMTVGYAAIYEFDFYINATKTASQIYKFNIRVNAVEGAYQCQLPSDALTSGHTSMTGLLDLDANDVLSIYVETDDANAGTHLTPVDMGFTVTSVSLDS